MDKIELTHRHVVNRFTKLFDTPINDLAKLDTVRNNIKYATTHNYNPRVIRKHKLIYTETVIFLLLHFHILSKKIIDRAITFAYTLCIHAYYQFRDKKTIQRIVNVEYYRVVLHLLNYTRNNNYSFRLNSVSYDSYTENGLFVVDKLYSFLDEDIERYKFIDNRHVRFKIVNGKILPLISAKILDVGTVAQGFDDTDMRIKTLFIVKTVGKVKRWCKFSVMNNILFLEQYLDDVFLKFLYGVTF